MAKLNIIPANILLPFRNVLSDGLHSKLCNDIKSLFGRIEKTDIISKDGAWKCSSKGILESKTGNKCQLPLNNPLSTLIQFGMQVNAIADNMGLLRYEEDKVTLSENGIDSGIPANVREWVKQQEQDLNSQAEADKVKAEKDKAEAEKALKETEEQVNA